MQQTTESRSQPAGLFDIQEEDWSALKRWVDVLVGADEVKMAESALKNLPGLWREKRPEWVIETERAILEKKGTPAFYRTNKWDNRVNPEHALELLRTTTRGQLIEKDVKAFADKKITPHLVDLGPGEYWLPIGLKMAGYPFTYYGIGLHPEAEAKAKEELTGHWSPDNQKWGAASPVIFVACELIEHLPEENDLRSDQLRFAPGADIIHISTPYGTYDTRRERLEWRKFGDLGHLRTYTPREFADTISKMFPEYSWAYEAAQPQHMRGVKQ